MPENSEQYGPEIPFHNLFSREIRPINGWKEWLDIWNEARTMEQMIGLLHCGFDVEESCGRREDPPKVDRLTFYFGIADGWRDTDLLGLPRENQIWQRYERYDEYGKLITKYPKDLRKMVAKKAFEMLCQKVFKEDLFDGDLFSRFWADVVATEGFLSLVQNFFAWQERPMSSGYYLRNLEHRTKYQSHLEREAVGFIKNLATLVWDIRRGMSSNGVAQKSELLFMARPWTVEILSALGEYDMLREWLMYFDKTSLLKLQEIAMRGILSPLKCYDGHFELVRNERPVADLDEACFLGSRAAWLLKEYELKKRVHGRLEAITRAERERDLAEEKVRRLRKH